MRRATGILLSFCVASLAIAQSLPEFHANHLRGETYIRSGHLKEAIPFLKKAYEIDPGNYTNGYDLALAYLQTGEVAKSRDVIAALIRQGDKAELHNLLADIEETEGHIDEAARQYEIAARMEPSEKNLFDLGSDLTLHRGFEPALKVFQFGSSRYPQSAKLRVGLGVAHYSLGQYDEAVEALCQAVGLDPKDTKALDFLGKMIDVSPQYADEVTRRLAHFVAIYPDNASANYYYALSLQKRTLSPTNGSKGLRAEQYLLRAVQLKPAFADAHYELGRLYEEDGKTSKALRHYELAATLRPDFATAHYHLARLYRKDGRESLAQKEFHAFEALKAKQ